MLIIKTEIKESQGKGVGVFSLENKSKGEIVWIEHPLFYKIIPYYEFDRLPEVQKEFIKKYATEYTEECMYYLDLDNTRFINHSNDAVIEWNNSEPQIAILLKDLKIGDEITCNYVRLNPRNAELDFIKNII